MHPAHRRRPPRAAAASVVLLMVTGCSAGPGPTGPPATPAASDPAATGTATPQDRPNPTAAPRDSAAPSGPAAPGPRARVRVAGTVARGLDAPWGLAFLPGGAALVSQRDEGSIVRVEPGGSVTELGEVPGVQSGGEGGLLGLALSPGFAEDRLLYAYFTGAQDNRVVRLRVGRDRLGDPEVVLDGIPRAGIHNGGRIAFGPDGWLYVATGDASDVGLAQDLASLAGKILRLTPDGRPAPGNPVDGSPVWSLGHRNVQGLAWDDRGRLWASEFGQDRFDELNLIRPGANYGWPTVEGEGGSPDYVDPVQVWDPDEASPSGVAVLGEAVYVAALRGARLWQVPLTGDGTGPPREHLVGEYGRLRTVAAAPDGSLWLMTSNTDGRGEVREGDDRILRLELR